MFVGAENSVIMGRVIALDPTGNLGTEGFLTILVLWGGVRASLIISAPNATF